MSVSATIRSSAWETSGCTGRTFSKFDVGDLFEKFAEKSEVSLKFGRNERFFT
jgi:hypothetical protein